MIVTLFVKYFFTIELVTFLFKKSLRIARPFFNERIAYLLSSINIARIRRQQ